MKSHTHLTTLPAGAPFATASPRQDNLNTDPAIVGFLAARERLEKREQELEGELASIRQILNGDTASVVLPAPTPPAQDLPNSPTISPPPSSRRSNTGLRQAVIDILKLHGPLTKDQILEMLHAKNFQFFGKPKPALDPILYSKKFLRNGKSFCLAVSG